MRTAGAAVPPHFNHPFDYAQDGCTLCLTIIRLVCNGTSRAGLLFVGHVSNVTFNFFGNGTVRLLRSFAAEASSPDLLLYQRTDGLLLTVDAQIIPIRVCQVKRDYGQGYGCSKVRKRG